jgi:hypothetical protein
MGDNSKKAVDEQTEHTTTFKGHLYFLLPGILFLVTSF